MVLPLLAYAAVAGVSAYIGTVIHDATESPNTVIQADKVNANSLNLSGENLLKYAILGGASYLMYKKFFKKGKG